MQFLCFLLSYLCHRLRRTTSNLKKGILEFQQENWNYHTPTQSKWFASFGSDCEYGSYLIHCFEGDEAVLVMALPQTVCYSCDRRANKSKKRFLNGLRKDFGFGCNRIIYITYITFLVLCVLFVYFQEYFSNQRMDTWMGREGWKSAMVNIGNFYFTFMCYLPLIFY